MRPGETHRKHLVEVVVVIEVTTVVVVVVNRRHRSQWTSLGQHLNRECMRRRRYGELLETVEELYKWLT